MSKLQTLSRGLRYMAAHPVTTLRWAASVSADGVRLKADEVKARADWHALMKPHCLPFEQFLLRNRLESATPPRLMNTSPQVQSVSGFELYILATLMRCLQARSVIEIGTYKGRTTYNLAANLADGGHIHTLNYVDPAAKREFVVGEMYLGTSLEPAVKTILANSMEFDFGPWHRSVDLMFIDGNHSLAYVRKDSENAFRCVRPGGIVAWHDVDPTHPESTAAALGACQEHGAPGWLIEGTQLLLAVQPG
jgi:hypothetical protein